MVRRWNRKIFDQSTPCATRLQLPLKQLLRPCIGKDFVLVLRTSSDLYVVETRNTKNIKSAIARIFLSSLLSPGSSILNTRTNFPGGDGSHTACIPSVSRLSTRLSLRSVLFHALSRLLSWKSQARIRGRRLLSSPAQCRSFYPNSFDARPAPALTAALYATRTRFAALEPSISGICAGKGIQRFGRGEVGCDIH